MKLLFWLLLGLNILYAGVFSVNIAPALKENRFMGIKILDQKQLSFERISGVKFTELSDVAYHQKSKKLYFVGDRGSLFIFHAIFTDRIEALKPLSGTKLRKRSGKKFKKWQRDSEGLTLDGEGHLIVSFEGKGRIAEFREDGRLLKKYQVPLILFSPKRYRSKNKSLEAVAWHPSYGVLTAAEWPLKRYDIKEQTVYALSGRQWHFKAEPEERSAISAIEVMDDGNLLVLERSYTGLFNPFVVTLKKVYLKECGIGQCKSKVLAKLDNHKGWAVDNFEGLARVGKNRYVMVSDDNENFFQKTLLIYFEVTE